MESEIADTAAIDMMANDVEAGIRLDERVENMDGLARRGGNDLRMEGSILSRDRRVELNDWVRPIATVDTTGDFAAIAEMDVLPIGGRYRVRTENGGE